MLLGEFSHRVLIVSVSSLDQPVEIAESPGRESESCYAEEGVEDLTVDFDPYFAGGVDCFFAGVVHGWCCAEEEEEEHCSPYLLN